MRALQSKAKSLRNFYTATPSSRLPRGTAYPILPTAFGGASEERQAVFEGFLRYLGVSLGKASFSALSSPALPEALSRSLSLSLALSVSL